MIGEKMEENKLVNLAIDSMWYLTKEEVEFFHDKISLTFAIYSEILANNKNSSSLSDSAKKIIFKNIVVSPFIAAKDGVDMATRYNMEDSNMLYDGTMLNFRGMARTRISLGITNKVTYDRKKNNDIHHAVSVPLQYFSLSNTSYREFSLFSILIDYISSRPQLHDGNENMVANSFINSREHSEVINALNDAFETYVAKLFLDFQQELKAQGAIRFDYETPVSIYRQISTQLKRYDFKSKTLLSSDVVQGIINNY